jgi:uncharacterized protein (DUF1684 family)
MDIIRSCLLRSPLVFSLLLAASGKAVGQSPPPTAQDQGYRQSYAKWKAELIEDRRRNWLPLVGLFWLKPGENSFGSDTSSAVVLPGSVPAHTGTFVLQGKVVTVNVLPLVSASIGGKRVTTAKLEPDVSGHPTVLEIGSLRMHVIQRGERAGIRVKDLKSPAVEKYSDPDFYPIGAVFVVAATWTPSDGKKFVQVPNVLGAVTATPVVGEARFSLAGQELRLTAVGGDAAHGLFIIFSDPTQKTDTYPAGRFLDTPGVRDGKVVLDFNRAYNPPCALTPFATCPLPPKENHLRVEIRAGEKYEHTQTSH